VLIYSWVDYIDLNSRLNNQFASPRCIVAEVVLVAVSFHFDGNRRDPPVSCPLTHTEKSCMHFQGFGWWIMSYNNYTKTWLSNTEGDDGVGEITTASVRIKGMRRTFKWPFSLHLFDSRG